MNKMYYMFYQNKYDFFLTSVNPLLEDTGKSQSMSIGSQKQKFYNFQKNSYNRANTPTHQKAFTKYGHRGPNSPEYMTN